MLDGMLHIGVFSFVVLLVGCATPPPPYVSPCSSASDQVSNVLNAYNSLHLTQKYPRDLKELKKFAADHKLPLNLRAFSKFEYRYANGIYDIDYTCRADGLPATMTGGQTIIIY